MTLRASCSSAVRQPTLLTRVSVENSYEPQRARLDDRTTDG